MLILWWFHNHHQPPFHRKGDHLASESEALWPNRLSTQLRIRLLRGDSSKRKTTSWDCLGRRTVPGTAEMAALHTALPAVVVDLQNFGALSAYLRHALCCQPGGFSALVASEGCRCYKDSPPQWGNQSATDKDEIPGRESNERLVRDRGGAKRDRVPLASVGNTMPSAGASCLPLPMLRSCCENDQKIRQVTSPIFFKTGTTHLEKISGTKWHHNRS